MLQIDSIQAPLTNTVDAGRQVFFLSTHYTHKMKVNAMQIRSRPRIPLVVIRLPQHSPETLASVETIDRRIPTYLWLVLYWERIQGRPQRLFVWMATRSEIVYVRMAPEARKPVFELTIVRA